MKTVEYKSYIPSDSINVDNRDETIHFVAKVHKSAILARLSWLDNRWFIEALNRLQERPSGTSKREESPSYTGQSAR